MALVVAVSGNAGLIAAEGSIQNLTAAVTGGTAPLTYVWSVSGAMASSVTVTADVQDASKAVVAYKQGATAKSGAFTITCAVTDSAAGSGNGTRAMSLADPAPARYTGAWATSYMSAMPADVQARFADLGTRREVTIPNTSDVLGSVQMGLIMDSI